MVRQYLIVRTVPRNPTVKDNYDVYIADTDSEEPLGTDIQDFTLLALCYIKFGNVCRAIADNIQQEGVKAVVTNLHSETQPFTDEQKQRLDELVNLALRGEFRWTTSYQKRHGGFRRAKY